MRTLVNLLGSTQVLGAGLARLRWVVSTLARRWRSSLLDHLGCGGCVGCGVSRRLLRNLLDRRRGFPAWQVVLAR